MMSNSLLPDWEAEPDQPDHSDRDMSFALDRSSLQFNTSSDRHATLLSKITQPIPNVALGLTGSGLAQASSVQQSVPGAAASQRSRSSSGGSGNSLASSYAASSGVSASSKNLNFIAEPPPVPPPTATTMAAVSMGGDYTKSSVLDADRRDPPSSSYIGEHHYWQSQKERLRVTDHQLAVSSAVFGSRDPAKTGGGSAAALPKKSSATRQRKAKSKKSASGTAGRRGVDTGESNQGTGASSSSSDPASSPPQTSSSSLPPSSGSQVSAVSTSPIETSTLNNNENKQSPANLRPREEHVGKGKAPEMKKRSNPVSPDKNANASLSFGIPSFHDHAPSPPPRDSRSAGGALNFVEAREPVVMVQADEEGRNCLDFLHFLVAGLEQTVASIEALAVSEQSAAAVIYRDKVMRSDQASERALLKNKKLILNECFSFLTPATAAATRYNICTPPTTTPLPFSADPSRL